MKKILFALVALLFTVSLISPAMAAPEPKPAKLPKVPKTMCIDVPNTSIGLELTIKKGSTLKEFGQKADLYQIQGLLETGVDIPVPVTGTGGIDPESRQFRFTLNTMQEGTAYSIIGYMDLDDEEGEIAWATASDADGLDDEDFNIEICSEEPR